MTSKGRINRGHPVAPIRASVRRLHSQTAGAGRFAAHRSAPPSSTAGSVAFVFQGGGSLSACQVGMVRALSEAGVRADFVVGSSAGAVNAVAFATGPRADLAPLESLWTSLHRQHVAPLSVLLILRAITGRSDGFFSNAGLRAMIDDHLPPRLQDTDIPAHVVVTDFHSGEPVVISRGATAPALLASSAFPGLYPPVTIDGRSFIDGGVSADTPILQAEQLGASVIYVLPAARSDELDAPMHGPMTLAYRALGQILDAATRRDTAAADGQVHTLPAPISTASNPVDFRDTTRLIAEGYRLTTQWLAAQGARTAAPCAG